MVIGSLPTKTALRSLLQISDGLCSTSKYHIKPSEKSLFLNMADLILIGLVFATGVMSTCPCAGMVDITNPDVGRVCVQPSSCLATTGCFTNKHVVSSNSFNLLRYCNVNIEVTSMINSAAEGQLVQCKCCNCQSGWIYNLLTVPVNQIVGYYSCETSCIGAATCFRGLTKAGVSLASGGTKDIYQCFQCNVLNCIQCQKQTVCKTCADEYAVDVIKTCTHCTAMYGSGCKTCTRANGCITCNTGLCVDPTRAGLDCYIPSDVKCAACTNSYCTNCMANYFLAPDKSCKLCNTLPNCATCSTSQNGCSSCTSPYILKSIDSSNTCIQCTDVPFCTACTDGPVCIRCQSGYFPDPSTSLSTCTPCSTISRCSTCSNNQTLCLSCQSDYYLDYSTTDNSCVACTINHCLACADGPICFSCENGFIPEPVDSKKCLQCFPDYFSFNNTCHQCQSNITGCTRCSYNGSILKCTRCKTHWALHSTSLLCIDCQQIPNCIQCSDFDTCSICKRPYLPSLTGSCDSCESGLEYFNNVCNIKGCLNALPDYSRCIACRTNNNYFYDSFKKSCICNSGYNSVKLQTATVCSSFCGNGIATRPEQQCDDSNLIDNDGCDRNCKIQPGFDCIPTLPNKCLLHYQIQEIKYNYAFKVQGKSRGKFSFSLLPFHEVFQYVNWSKYIALNISDDFVKRQTMIHYLKYETKEICIEFDYKKQIQNHVVIATFTFFKFSPDSQFKSSSVQLVQLSNQYQKLVGTASVSAPPQIIAEPSETSLQIQLRGVNSALSFEEERIIQAYKASQIGFVAISIVILIFFFVGSYSHKMIGLQTIQILQYFYFMGMIVDDNSKTSLKSMNVLKYTAFGGYSSYKVFFGDISQQIQSLTYQTVDRNFIYVGLMKYFVINVNFSLVIPILALAIYGVYLTRKLRNRSKYIQFRQQINKDLHTVFKRSTQWIYDHCFFPLVNIFSMISFFCTILQLDIKAKSSQNANQNQAILQIVEKSNFALNLFFLFLTFFIFAFQVFVSYGQFKYANMTEEQKSRKPSSMIEKLEYDANNPDVQNYKHGYILVYLLLYLLLEIVLMMSVLIKEMSRYGIEIMLGLQFVYLLILWIWQPYYPIVNFHNKALKFNHLTVFFFTLTCQCLQRIDIPPQVEVTLIFLSLFMLIGVFFGGTIRVYLEFQFRRNMSQNSNILDLKKEIKKLSINPKLEKMSIKERYFLNNKYIQNFEDLKTRNYNQRIEDGRNLSKYRQSDKLDKYFLRDMEVQKAKQNFVNDFAGLNHKNKLKYKLQQHEPESLIDLKMRMKRSQRQLF